MRFNILGLVTLACYISLTLQQNTTTNAVSTTINYDDLPYCDEVTTIFRNSTTASNNFTSVNMTTTPVNGTNLNSTTPSALNMTTASNNITALPTRPSIRRFRIRHFFRLFFNLFRNSGRQSSSFVSSLEQIVSSSFNAQFGNVDVSTKVEVINSSYSAVDVNVEKTFEENSNSSSNFSTEAARAIITSDSTFNQIANTSAANGLTLETTKASLTVTTTNETVLVPIDPTTIQISPTTTTSGNFSQTNQSTTGQFNSTQTTTTTSNQTSQTTSPFQANTTLNSSVSANVNATNLTTARNSDLTTASNSNLTTATGSNLTTASNSNLPSTAQTVVNSNPTSTQSNANPTSQQTTPAKTTAQESSTKLDVKTTTQAKEVSTTNAQPTTTRQTGQTGQTTTANNVQTTTLSQTNSSNVQSSTAGRVDVIQVITNVTLTGGITFTVSVTGRQIMSGTVRLTALENSLNVLVKEQFPEGATFSMKTVGTEAAVVIQINSVSNSSTNANLTSKINSLIESIDKNKTALAATVGTIVPLKIDTTKFEVTATQTTTVNGVATKVETCDKKTGSATECKTVIISTNSTNSTIATSTKPVSGAISVKVGTANLIALVLFAISALFFNADLKF